MTLAAVRAVAYESAAVTLSGGLDSAVVAGVLTRLGRQVRAFSIRASESEHPLLTGNRQGTGKTK